MRHLAIALAAALAAAPLAAQPRPEAHWIAEAERLEDVDPAAAHAFVQRALARLPAGDALRMRAVALRCWTAAGAQPDSLAAYAEAGIAEATRAGDARALASLRVCRGYGLEAGGRLPEAMAEYDRGVAEGRRIGSREVTAATLLLRGQLRYYRGEFTTALADLNESYALFTALNKPGQQRNALNAIANVYADRNVAQYDRALEYYQQVLAANQRAGSRAGVATAHFNVGSTLERMGRLNEALAQYRRGLAMDVARGDSGEVATDRRAVGIVLYKLGRPAEALALFDQVRAFAERTGDEERGAQIHLSRGVALRMLGRADEAIAELERARAYFERNESQRFLEKVQEERALAFAARGAWREAFEARGAQMELLRTLENAAHQEQSSRLRVQFDSEKKETENRALTRENELRRRALDAAARVRGLQMAVLVLSAFIIAALVLLVVRQVASSRRLRSMALTDELTRLPNRRHLFLLADGAWRAARSRGASFSVLALDVDHFKRINDRFGHDAGDRVLQRVATAARGALREGDHVGRTGGEEFIAVLPGAPAADAAQVAEQVRAAVERIDCRDLDPELRVTVSVGIATWTPGDEPLPGTCRRADESLYRAKEAGRNRVEMAGAA